MQQVSEQHSLVEGDEGDFLYFFFTVERLFSVTVCGRYSQKAAGTQRHNIFSV